MMLGRDDEERIPRVSVRLAGVSQSRVAFVARHNLRQGKMPGYVDSTRTHLNVALAGPGGGNFNAAAGASVERYHQRVGQRMQPRQARLVEGIITFSRTAQPIVAEDLDQAHRCARRLVDDIMRDHGHGAQLVSLVYHGDESAPHYHFVLDGVGADGLAILKRVHKREGVHIQDLGGAAFAPMGIQRGISVVERIRRGDDPSKIIHRSVRQLHDDLPREIESTQLRLAAQSVSLADLQAKASTTEARLDKARADLVRLQAQSSVDEAKATRLAERVKDYTARLAKQRVVIEAHAPKPVELTVVTGIERGLLGTRQTTEQEQFYPLDEVDAFTERVNQALLSAKDQARLAEQARAKAQKEADRLRAIIAPYPELGWRLQSRAGGDSGPEQGRLIHADKRYVYAVEHRTNALIEGARSPGVKFKFGMVLEFDRAAVAPPAQPVIRPWGLGQVIEVIKRFVVGKMPNFIAVLTKQLAEEADKQRQQEREVIEQVSSDLAPIAVDDGAPPPSLGSVVVS
jgi:hypothetical protein